MSGLCVIGSGETAYLKSRTAHRRLDGCAGYPIGVPPSEKRMSSRAGGLQHRDDLLFCEPLFQFGPESIQSVCAHDVKATIRVESERPRGRDGKIFGDAGQRPGRTRSAMICDTVYRRKNGSLLVKRLSRSLSFQITRNQAGLSSNA